MMKRLLFSVFILTAGLIFTTGTISYAAGSLSLQEKDQMHKDMRADTGMTHKTHGDMKAMMGEMRDSMMNVHKTGDPDHDFAAMMIQHHKGAIKMSQQEIDNGKDKKIISIAKKVIKDQKSEIKDLQKFIRTNKSGSGMAMSQKRDTSMQSQKDMKDMKDMTGSSEHKMMDKMQNMEMTGNQDNDYASMMIMHHQHGIDMANDYLDKGKNSKLMKMAKKMIKESESQIKDLEKLKTDESK